MFVEQSYIKPGQDEVHASPSFSPKRRNAAAFLQSLTISVRLIFSARIKVWIGNACVVGKGGWVDRYSELRPLTLEERYLVARAAIHFFSPMNHRAVCEAIGKAPDSQRIQPLSGVDFLKFLDLTEIFDKKPDVSNNSGRYQHSVKRVVDALVGAHILNDMGQQGPDVFFGHGYYFLRELSTLQQQNDLWIAPALGPQFLEYKFRSHIVQITGQDGQGQPRAGTGLVVAPRWVLTARHVLIDMTVDGQQQFGGQTCRVLRLLPQRSRPSALAALFPDERKPVPDVGLVEVDVDLAPLPGLTFRTPDLLEPVFTLGYPLVPQAREAVLVMQRGEVSVAGMIDTEGQRLFLYSAISRPGNSGGPVLSADGCVVGLVAQEKTQQVIAEPGASLQFNAPYYAGVPADETVRAVRDLVPELDLPVENYQ
jgi:S1-C subfamily serine protease